MCSRLTREVRPLQSAGLCVNSYNSSAALLQLMEETAANQPCKEDTLEEPEETIDILSMGKDVDCFTVSLHRPNGRQYACRWGCARETVSGLWKTVKISTSLQDPTVHYS